MQYINPINGMPFDLLEVAAKIMHIDEGFIMPTTADKQDTVEKLLLERGPLNSLAIKAATGMQIDLDYALKMLRERNIVEVGPKAQGGPLNNWSNTYLITKEHRDKLAGEADPEKKVTDINAIFRDTFTRAVNY